MKKELMLLVFGMVLVVVGALLRINQADFSNYVLIAGMAVEAFVLASLVIKSLKNLK